MQLTDKREVLVVVDTQDSNPLAIDQAESFLEESLERAAVQASARFYKKNKLKAGARLYAYAWCASSPKHPNGVPIAVHKFVLDIRKPEHGKESETPAVPDPVGKD